MKAIFEHPYRGRTAALLTQHGKERAIAPALESALGCAVQRVDGFDTDRLGNFTRDIPRAGTQLEAARRKARLGMELSGLPLGIASEGAFGVDPIIGISPWNIEIVIWIDDGLAIEVVGVAQGRGSHAHVTATQWPQVEAFARQWGFPTHQLVLRPEGQDDPRIRKGIATWTELEVGFDWAQGRSQQDRVFVEVDARAHANPTRMHQIRLAVLDLTHKLATECPACRIPGFSIVERIPGLPCSQCGQPTSETRADVYGCVRCAYRPTRERTIDVADPERCDVCNP